MVLDVFEGARHGYKLFGADRGCFGGAFSVLRKLRVSAQYARLHDKEIYISPCYVGSDRLTLTLKILKSKI